MLEQAVGVLTTDRPWSISPVSLKQGPDVAPPSMIRRGAAWRQLLPPGEKGRYEHAAIPQGELASSPQSQHVPGTVRLVLAHALPSHPISPEHFFLLLHRASRPAHVRTRRETRGPRASEERDTMSQQPKRRAYHSIPLRRQAAIMTSAVQTSSGASRRTQDPRKSYVSSAQMPAMPDDDEIFEPARPPNSVRW
jgi:hypothetical protein